MATWAEIERDAPDLATRVRRVFEAGTNKTIATLRADGGPRISAIEAEFGDGRVSFGMMGGSVKLRDVRRDPRVALHSPTIEPPSEGWEGDAKLTGVAVEVDPPADTPHVGAGFFVLDVTEVVLTALGGEPPDHLVISSWHAGRGLRRRQRT